jgi:hypothetical protein
MHVHRHLRLQAWAGNIVNMLPALEETPRLAQLNRHLPIRPSWNCAVDSKAWPCPSARVHLRTAYADDPVALAVYMSQELAAAAVDMGRQGSLPPDLFSRFMTWT